jgi:hypothetical protein
MAGISMTRLLQAAPGVFGVVLALLSLCGCNRSAPTLESSAPAPEVQFGSRIIFGQGGNSEAYRISGWSKTEEKFTWSEGTSAQLRIRVPASEDTISLKMRIAALIKPPELPFQPVEIWVNDQKIAEWQVGNTAEFVATIPHDLMKLGGPLTVLIKTPKATSPQALGLNADPRVLGVCCFDLELSKG